MLRISNWIPFKDWRFWIDLVGVGLFGRLTADRVAAGDTFVTMIVCGAFWGCVINAVVGWHMHVVMRNLERQESVKQDLQDKLAKLHQLRVRYEEEHSPGS